MLNIGLEAHNVRYGVPWMLLSKSTSLPWRTNRMISPSSSQCHSLHHHARTTHTRATRLRQKAAFWRGGTSNAVMISGQNLPEWRTIRERYPDGKLDLKECALILGPLYCAIMGSPDPSYGRQLNGMGGGISSLSKAVIVDRPPAGTSASAGTGQVDLDYLFIQIGIRDGKLDLAGNCGNMTSAVAPFGLEEALVDVKHDSTSYGVHKSRESFPLTVRLRNLNTSRIIDANINAVVDEDTGRFYFDAQGEYVLDGVAGYASPVTLSFISPGGAKTGKALPTGNPTDVLEWAPGQTIRASLLDISNPGVFIDGRNVGWTSTSTPEQLNSNTELMQKLEVIRRIGASMMDMDPDTPSVPKIVLLYPPADDDVDITCQALSMEQAHKAVPMTLGLNLGVACKISGTIAHRLARHRDPQKTIVSHPSGRVEVGADISPSGEIVSAKVIRTARCLMDGYVNVVSSKKLTTRPKV